MYKLMVVHWSIFTLSLQLIYCASVHSNTDSVSTVETFCSQESENYVQENSIESSLTLELKPHLIHGTCKRLFLAPESHGFFVRLHNPLKSIISKKTQSTKKNNGEKMKNSTSSCPLSIFSANDPIIPPWRLDPCQLEADGVVEDPVRLLQGRLRIVWNHSGNMPNYRLLITALGKGPLCEQENKHPCLKLGQEILLCISSDLVCDGVQHCPSGNEYDSDENIELCDRKKLTNTITHISNINVWEHLSMTFLKNWFNSDPTSPAIIETTTATTESPVRKTEFIVEEVEIDMKPNNIKKNLTRGLSRYGPWGYLMLGMLLCGCALLICGLWECCCRHHKPTNPNGIPNPTDVNINGDSYMDSPGTGSSSSEVTPPNYDEIDPPPSYSTLFPGQKSSEDLTQLENNSHHQPNATIP